MNINELMTPRNPAVKHIGKRDVNRWGPNKERDPRRVISALI
jgi:hypothetical protein